MIDKIQENIDNSFLLGCVKYKNNLSFYLMPIAYWILNYAQYDPYYNPEDWKDGIVFRNDILNVNDESIGSFIEAIQDYKIDLDSIDIKKYNFNDIFYFFIDFHSKTFISYFDDIEIEKYLPDEKWVGIFDTPLKYLPQELSVYFF
ncbi:hypothetical protein FAM09_12935 [Niastella caeni]|uniref:Uncharacterized protein n=1 Tax=Niastella caeni TaxID=2569763 RepID=A0A4S8HZ14_9BACT|nr:hypothetical protein [Niastella caeni]THU39404.1 hypothetical protein FAM09_12935 [Niastella caeni]